MDRAKRTKVREDSVIFDARFFCDLAQAEVGSDHPAELCLDKSRKNTSLYRKTIQIPPGKATFVCTKHPGSKEPGCCYVIDGYSASACSTSARQGMEGTAPGRDTAMEDALALIFST